MVTEHFLEITGLIAHTTGFPAKMNREIKLRLNLSLLPCLLQGYFKWKIEEEKSSGTIKTYTLGRRCFTFYKSDGDRCGKVCGKAI